MAETLGTFDGKLILESDDPRQPTYTINLLATVVPPPPLGPDPTSLAVALTEGDTMVRTIRLKNFSSDTLSWTQTSAEQPAWWQITPTAGQLPPGATAILRIRLDSQPLPVGTYQQTVFFVADDRDTFTFSFPLTLQVTEKIVPLTVTITIPEQALPLLDTAYRLNLATYLPQDVHYAATALDTSIVRVATDSSVLLLSPQQIGTTTVEVRIRDRFDQEEEVSFQVVVVAPNRAPEVMVSSDSVLMLPQEVRTLVLVELFTDPDHDILTYTAEPADSGVVRATVAGSMLTLTSQASGSTTVLLRATDPSGAQVTFTLLVEVAQVTATERNTVLPYQLTSYPNPSSDRVAVHYAVPVAGLIQLTLHDEYGRLIASLATQRHSVGEHILHYQVTGLPPGLYLLRLSTQERTMMHKMVVL